MLWLTQCHSSVSWSDQHTANVSGLLSRSTLSSSSKQAEGERWEEEEEEEGLTEVVEEVPASACSVATAVLAMAPERLNEGECHSTRYGVTVSDLSGSYGEAFHSSL